jgi:hypothetical protein
MNDLYTQGFIDKCAEHGVDPEQLVKSAMRGQRALDLLRKAHARNPDRKYPVGSSHQPMLKAPGEYLDNFRDMKLISPRNFRETFATTPDLKRLQELNSPIRGLPTNVGLRGPEATDEISDLVEYIRNIRKADKGRAALDAYSSAANKIDEGLSGLL